VPAKINLHLSVGDLRPDGYHDLVTVFHAVDLTDEVTATAAPQLRLDLSGDGADTLPSGPDNLAWQAAALLADQLEVTPEVALHVAKAIPVAGGMAGGSADAAAALLACSALWHADLHRDELATLAARLGSDVGFALAGHTALGTGRGEELAPVLTSGTLHWVLALAAFGISTADAYRELDQLRAGAAPPEPIGGPEPLLDALRRGDVEQVAATLGNDLEAAALSIAPALGETLAAGRELGALAGIVSGTSLTCPHP
jgi:4-diphosphocytidyl-2-C-methyl-D-erythritol kinase